jgi:hypothetical protein
VYDRAGSAIPMPRASEVNVPGITDDILRAVEVLEDQLEQVLGPRPAPPRPILRNVNAVVAEQMTTGDHVADAVAATMGSWRFIAIQSALLLVWVILNVVGWIKHWDPYPLSCSTWPSPSRRPTRHRSS